MSLNLSSIVNIITSIVPVFVVVLVLKMLFGVFGSLTTAMG